MTWDTDMKIAFVTDLHLTVAGEYLALNRRQVAEKIIEQINLSQADVVLIGGDTVDFDQFKASETSGISELSSYSIDILSKLQSKCKIATAGNHDPIKQDFNDPYSALRAVLRSSEIDLLDDARVIELGEGWALYCLNSFIVDSHTKKDSQELGRYRAFTELHLRQMSSRLREYMGHNVIVMTHYPIARTPCHLESWTGGKCTAGSLIDSSSMKAAQSAVSELGNVKLVLQGHTHVCDHYKLGGNEAKEPGHISFITGGAFCGRWWNAPSQRNPASVPGFTLIDTEVPNPDFIRCDLTLQNHPSNDYQNHPKFSQYPAIFDSVRTSDCLE